MTPPLDPKISRFTNRPLPDSSSPSIAQARAVSVDAPMPPASASLSLALAVLLPNETPYRAVIIDAVFAVVTTTLVVQGLAIAPLLRRLTL